jgi:predicted TIM-barrel enzyme
MAGRGSLAGVPAHGNANEIVRDMAREVLPVVKHRPVLAGVGGPGAEPQETEFILRSTERCHGFDGASSMERLPTERAMTDQTRRFKAVAFEKASL